MKTIRYIIAGLCFLLLGALAAIAQTNDVVTAVGATQDPLPFLSGLHALYGMMGVAVLWAGHVNWPRLLDAYEWIGNQGGVWGILRNIGVGKKIIAPLLLCAICALASGCNTTHFEATRADGTKVSVINRRFLWTTDSYVANLTTNGASLTANKSNVDAAAISAITAGVADGLSKVLNK